MSDILILQAPPGTLATEAKQDDIVSAIENITIPAPAGGATEAKQDTLNSLIETLHELAQRLAPLGGVIANTNQMRAVVTGAVTASGGGYITSAQSIAEKNVAGVSYTQRIAIENNTAIQSNINNVTA